MNTEITTKANKVYFNFGNRVICQGFSLINLPIDKLKQYDFYKLPLSCRILLLLENNKNKKAFTTRDLVRRFKANNEDIHRALMVIKRHRGDFVSIPLSDGNRNLYGLGIKNGE